MCGGWARRWGWAGVWASQLNAFFIGGTPVFSVAVGGGVVDRITDPTHDYSRSSVHLFRHGGVANQRRPVEDVEKGSGEDGDSGSRIDAELVNRPRGPVLHHFSPHTTHPAPHQPRTPTVPSHSPPFHQAPNHTPHTTQPTTHPLPPPNTAPHKTHTFRTTSPHTTPHTAPTHVPGSTQPRCSPVPGTSCRHCNTRTDPRSHLSLTAPVHVATSAAYRRSKPDHILPAPATTTDT